MPNRFSFRPDEDENNPLLQPQGITGGSNDAYEKLLMDQLKAKPIAEAGNEDADNAQLAASLGSAANALGSVGGRTADSSGLQNWADLMSKRSMQKQELANNETQKRQNLLAQLAIYQGKKTDADKARTDARIAKKEDKETDFENKKDLLELVNAGKSEKVKPPSADEKTSALFATRAKDASTLAEDIEKGGYDPSSYGASFRSTSLPFVGQLGASSEDRSYNQAKRSFISAVLRKESGAAISDKEYSNEEKKYFPEPGDGPEQLAQKAAERQRAVQTLITASGGAYSPDSQMPFDYKKPVAKPDGLIANDKAPAGAPKMGDVIKGYKYKGGDPADKASWEKVQ